MKLKHLLRFGLVLCAVVSLTACKTISVFDQYAYTQTTSLKVDALDVMDKAASSYASNATDVEALSLKVDKAYEYEKHRPKNEITSKMWEILKNPNKNLLGGFLSRWKQNSTLSKTFITEAKTQVGEAFDMIIELESQKIKPSDKSVSDFLSNNQ